MREGGKAKQLLLRAVVRAQLEAVTRLANGAGLPPIATDPHQDGCVCMCVVDDKVVARIDQTLKRSMRQFVCNSSDVFVN